MQNIGTLNMENCRIRKIMDGLEALIEVSIDNTHGRKDKLLTTIGHY